MPSSGSARLSPSAISRNVLSIQRALGSYFLIDVNLESIPELHLIPEGDLRLEYFVRDDDATAESSCNANHVKDKVDQSCRKTLQIDCFLKSLLLLDDLSLPDFFFLARDIPRKAETCGAFLQQRLLAVEMLAKMWVKRTQQASESELSNKMVLDTVGQTQQSIYEMDADTLYKTPSEVRWDGANSDPVHEVTSPFARFYLEHFPKCLSNAASDSDCWRTRKSAWKAVVDIIFNSENNLNHNLSNNFKLSMSSRVWQPFHSDGACANYLQELGLKNVCGSRSGEDFFKISDGIVRRDKLLRTRLENASAASTEDNVNSNFVDYDILLDNPPFTCAKARLRLLKRLKELNRPFCVLLPASVVLQGSQIRDIFCDSESVQQLQLIIPRVVEADKLSVVIDAGIETVVGSQLVPCKGLIWVGWKLKLENSIHLI